MQGLRRRSAVLVMVALSLALAVPTAPAAADPELSPSSGCGHARRAGTRARTVTVDGWTRTYFLTVPPRYTGRRRVPLVVDLHGAGSNAPEEALLSRMRDQAGARGWIVATPESGRGFWLPPNLSPDDHAFVRAVVQDVGRRLCVDTERRFATGMSNGAGMAAAMTCLDRRVFAAAGVVAGVNLFATCTDHRSTPILAVHGVLDTIVPYEGGTVGGGGIGGGLSVVSVEDRMADWAERNDCTSGPVQRELYPTVNRFRYHGCRQPVQWLEVEDGGHTWPGGPDIPRLGPTNHDLDATDYILDFFAAQ
jgi:polyhydroxybutyrate depolymerase